MDDPDMDRTVRVAAVVLHDAHCGCLTDGHLNSYMQLARDTLDAARPLIEAEARATEHQRIAGGSQRYCRYGTDERHGWYLVPADLLDGDTDG